MHQHLSQVANHGPWPRPSDLYGLEQLGLGAGPNLLLPKCCLYARFGSGSLDHPCSHSSAPHIPQAPASRSPLPLALPAPLPGPQPLPCHSSQRTSPNQLPTWSPIYTPPPPSHPHPKHPCMRLRLQNLCPPASLRL